MDVHLTNTILAGRILSGTMASWNAKWSEDRLRSSEAWKSTEREIAGWAGGASNRIFISNPEFVPDAEAISELLSYDGAYGDIWGVRMTIDGKSTWKVTGNSSLHTLTLEEEAVIKAPAGYETTIYTNCAMDTDASTR